MAYQSVTTEKKQAAVVARDEALRASLVLLFEVCGMDAVGFAVPETLLDNCSPDEIIVFVDISSTGDSGFAEIEELRRRGWKGTAVLMAETELRSDQVWPEGPSRVLVKPFSSDQVLAILSSLSGLSQAA